MSGLTKWWPPVFEPSLEKDYKAQQLQRVILLARLGSVIGAFSFFAYGAWDLLLDPQALSNTGPIRLAVIAYFALAFAATYWRLVRSSSRVWISLTFSLYLVVTVGFALVLRQLPGGFVAGIPGLILGMIFIPALVITFAQAVMLVLPMVALPVLVMYVSGATHFELLNAIAWIGGAGAFAVGFVYLLDVINRRAFELERSLEREKKRSEALLLNILPQIIAERLKTSESVIADEFPSATVLFADLVGFTELSRRLAAGEVVALLNDLFSRFDDLVERHDVEKIKTIGDAYMVAAGVPASRSDHAEVIAKLAIDMREAFDEFRRDQGLNLKLRIGAHSGIVVAGIIGTRKFAYDLWGDTVNIASRMESQGVPDEIQISAETRALLPEAYQSEERGEIELKGHAARRVFLLKGMQRSLTA